MSDDKLQQAIVELEKRKKHYFAESKKEKDDAVAMIWEGRGIGMHEAISYLQSIQSRA